MHDVVSNSSAYSADVLKSATLRSFSARLPKKEAISCDDGSTERGLCLTADSDDLRLNRFSSSGSALRFGFLKSIFTIGAGETFHSKE